MTVGDRRDTRATPNSLPYRPQGAAEPERNARIPSDAAILHAVTCNDRPRCTAVLPRSCGLPPCGEGDALPPSRAEHGLGADDALQVDLRHTASLGVTCSFRSGIGAADLVAALDAHISDAREVSIVGDAPTIVHETLIKGLRSRAQGFDRRAAEPRAVVLLLWQSGCLNHDETAWLAGFVAPDAPMRALSPAGPATEGPVVE